MPNVYLDWAATTVPDPDILNAMSETAAAFFGNPSSLHAEGRLAAGLLKDARERCAAALGVKPDSIVFTAGGSESNAIALLSVLRRRGRCRIVTTEIEHASAYETAVTLRSLGFEVSLVPPEPDGRVSVRKIERELTDDTVMVSCMIVNNETGAIQPVEEIGAMLADRTLRGGRKIHFHCDGVQAVGKIPIRLASIGADTVSISAHKLNGPRGAGILYVKRRFDVLTPGGGQESGMRSGTENLPAVHGMSIALERAAGAVLERLSHSRELERFLVERLTAIPGCTLLPESRRGLPDSFSPYIVSAAFPPIPGEVLVRIMSDRGFSISTGSACSAGKRRRTRVVTAMGVPEDTAFSSIRVSFGHSTTREELGRFCDALERETTALRREVHA